ncbi:endo-alpha-N-acetylgalactosaminidase family protein [Streptomyces yanii]|uniref:endo-alpha-N-acetylgalactosaminidase family protein n=1 Tax=Streptomyces yanii TaxID=78510 RepID=UPI0031EECB8F
MYRPLGADRTKDFVVSNIEYNTNSFASHPFTRVLDDIRRAVAHRRPRPARAG